MKICLIRLRAFIRLFKALNNEQKTNNHTNVFVLGSDLLIVLFMQAVIGQNDYTGIYLKPMYEYSDWFRATVSSVNSLAVLWSAYYVLFLRLLLEKFRITLAVPFLDGVFPNNPLHGSDLPRILEIGIQARPPFFVYNSGEILQPTM